jgi:putative glycosyltransferase (TIGR04372 family)
MSVWEIIESGCGRFLRTELYEQMGIKLIENTPEEIRALAIEMEERLNGTWQTTNEDEELHHRFRSFLKKSELH